MKISVIGLGFVGLSLAVTNATKGFKTIGVDINDLKINDLKKLFKGIVDYGSAFRYKEITVFRDKVLIKADSKKKALSLFNKYLG